MSKKSTTPPNYDVQIARISNLIDKWNARVSALEENRQTLINKKKEIDMSYLFRVLEERHIPLESVVDYLK